MQLRIAIQALPQAYWGTASEARGCNSEEPHNSLSKPVSVRIHTGINWHELLPPLNPIT